MPITNAPLLIDRAAGIRVVAGQCQRAEAILLNDTLIDLRRREVGGDRATKREKSSGRLKVSVRGLSCEMVKLMTNCHVAGDRPEAWVGIVAKNKLVVADEGAASVSVGPREGNYWPTLTLLAPICTRPDPTMGPGYVTRASCRTSLSVPLFVTAELTKRTILAFKRLERRVGVNSRPTRICVGADGLDEPAALHDHVARSADDASGARAIAERAGSVEDQQTVVKDGAGDEARNRRRRRCRLAACRR